tara:strand:+ start:5652 stop:5939 length:288 start_codon:yes stop_codon:yes gene_type:complete
MATCGSLAADDCYAPPSLTHIVVTNKSLRAVREMLQKRGYVTYRMIQKKLRIGYFRTTAILEKLHAKGHIADLKGPFYRAPHNTTSEPQAQNKNT